MNGDRRCDALDCQGAGFSSFATFSRSAIVGPNRSQSVLAQCADGYAHVVSGGCRLVTFSGVSITDLTLFETAPFGDGEYGATSEGGWQCSAEYSNAELFALITASVVCASPTEAFATCADGSAEETFGNAMVGCGGSTSQSAAGALCGSNSHVCSVSEYLAQNTTNQPVGIYWLATAFDIGPTSSSPVSGCYAAPNITLRPFCDGTGAVCSYSGTDDFDNTCSDRLGCTDSVSGSTIEWFGGCADSAGALCCLD